MIKLNLQMFGGGSSGDDGVGANKSTDITKGVYHEHHGSAGGHGNMLGNGQAQSGGSWSKSSSSSKQSKGDVVRGGLIPRETYVVYEIKNGKESATGEEMTGKDIMDRYAYRSGIEKWAIKSYGGGIHTKSSDDNKRYIIRKKRK